MSEVNGTVLGKQCEEILHVELVLDRVHVDVVQVSRTNLIAEHSQEIRQLSGITRLGVLLNKGVLDIDVKRFSNVEHFTSARGIARTKKLLA